MRKSYHDFPTVISICDGEAIKQGKRDIKSTFVWMNEAPKKAKKAILNYETASLRKMFGKNILKPIEMERPPTTGGSAVAEMFSHRDMITAFDDEMDDVRTVPQYSETLRRSAFVKSKEIRHDKPINIIEDMNIFLDDNLQVFKEKIQAVTEIPTYRQFIWLETKCTSVAPCFDVLVDDTFQQVDIMQISKYPSNVSGVPVDNSLYENRSLTVIKNREYTTTMDIINKLYKNFSWYVLDLNDILSDKYSLASAHESDKYIEDVIYYSIVYRFWPMITKNIFSIYLINEGKLGRDYFPESASTKRLIKKFKLETELLGASRSKKLFKYDTSFSIVTSQVTQMINKSALGVVVSLVNLFDTLALNANIVAVQCKTTIAGSRTTLTKVYNNYNITDTLTYANNAVHIIILKKDFARFILRIEDTGTIFVKTVWLQRRITNTSDIGVHIEDVINPVIVKINNMGETISIYKLNMFNSSNIYIQNISFVITIQHRLSSSDIDTFNNTIVTEFESAGIIRSISSSHQYTLFAYTKGMTNITRSRRSRILHNEYDIKKNPFELKKWEADFILKKTCKVTPRVSDIMVEINNMSGSEINNSIRYVMIMLTNLRSSRKMSGIITEKANIADNKLRKMKELDPVLFDIKKLYNTKMTYSQICQKPTQPTMVDSPEKGAVKFWNFTLNQPAYYRCDSKKYKYLYFKTGVHPKNICVPCCKKVAPVPGSKHGDLYNRCIIEKKIDNSKKNITRSRYITTYGKVLEEGRLSYLPAKSLEQLFYKPFPNKNDSIDKNCIPDLGYYVYGTPQNVGMVSYVGILLIIANAMGVSSEQIITDFITKMKKNKKINWRIVLPKNICSDFASIDDFATNITSALVMGNETKYDVYWNDIILAIADRYMNIRIVKFIDVGNDNVSLFVPCDVSHVSDYISDTHKYILTIHNEVSPGNWMIYPIYTIELSKYTKSGEIGNRMFDKGDLAINIISSIIEKYLNKMSTTDKEIDLDFAVKFTEQVPEYQIVKKYIDSNQLCYAVLINNKKTSKNIYFPVNFSVHTDYKFEMDKTVRGRADMSDMESVLTMLKEMDLPIERWLSLHDKIVGLSCDNKYLWFDPPVDQKKAIELHDLKITKLYYDPIEINKTINTKLTSLGKNTAIAEPDDISNLLYEHFSYKIFVINFMKIIRSFKNTKMRKKIKCIIAKFYATRDVMIRELQDALSDYPDDFDTILATINNNTIKKHKLSSSTGDILNSSISVSTIDKDSLIHLILLSTFRFDNIFLNEVNKMPRDEIVAKIRSVMNIKIATPKINKFSDNIVACTKKIAVDYCDGESLILPAGKLEKYLVYLANDIKNPIKYNIIKHFNVFRGRMTFKRRLNEQIYIE